MTGEQWVQNVNKWHQGVGALVQKFEEAEKSKDWSYLWANQYTPFHKALNRMAELKQAFFTISPADPWYVRAVSLRNAHLDDEGFKELNNFVRVTGDAYRYHKRKDGRILPNFGKYFLDVVQERGEQIDKALDLGFDELLEFMKKYLPWILAGGAILIVLNVVSLVPKR